jgi:hypothetical protein
MSEDERRINNSPWIDYFFFLVILWQKVTLLQFLGRNFPFFNFKKFIKFIFPPFFSLFGEHDITGLSTGYCLNGRVQKCGQLSENLSINACQTVTLQN